MQKNMVLVALLLPLLVSSAFDRVPEHKVQEQYETLAKKALKLKVKTLEGDLPLAEVNVTVFKNGLEVDQFTTRYKGKFKYSLDEDAIYELRFSKEGFVTKSVVFDTQGKLSRDEHAFAFNLRMIPGADDLLNEQTVAHVFFSNRLNDFTYVKQYTPDLLQAYAAE